MREELALYLRFLKAERNMSPETLRAYENDLEGFAEFCSRAGITRSKQVDHKLLRRYLSNQQTRGYSKSTIARRSSAIRGFFRFLVQRGLLDVDPAAAMSPPHRERRLPRVLRLQESEGGG